MKTEQVQKIRVFNRYYTDLLGLLNSHLLNSSYSLAEGRILFEIFSGGKSKASDIVANLSIDKGYLSRILKKMEKDGLIHRHASDADKRVTFLSLSPHGLEVFGALDLASDLQIHRITQHLDTQKREQLIECMDTIMQILRKE